MTGNVNERMLFVSIKVVKGLAFDDCHGVNVFTKTFIQRNIGHFADFFQFFDKTFGGFVCPVIPHLDIEEWFEIFYIDTIGIALFVDTINTNGKLLVLKGGHLKIDASKRHDECD